MFSSPRGYPTWVILRVFKDLQMLESNTSILVNRKMLAESLMVTLAFSGH